jgi:hypothetical protein
LDENDENTENRFASQANSPRCQSISSS